MQSIPRLHVLTDETVQSRYTHLEIALRAAQGGADAVQLREKRERPTRDLLALALALRDGLTSSATRLVINDRVDVAAAAGVGAVHLGRQDLPPAAARAILGPAGLVGATANSLAEALELAAEPIDYLGVGPVFGTGTKARPAPTIGLEGLARVVAAAGKPVIAIGNITEERVHEVLDCGAWGVAVVNAVVGAEDLAGAVRAFRERIDRWLEEKNR